jgi:hypothetical protein
MRFREEESIRECLGRGRRGRKEASYPPNLECVPGYKTLPYLLRDGRMVSRVLGVYSGLLFQSSPSSRVLWELFEKEAFSEKYPDELITERFLASQFARCQKQS